MYRLILLTALLMTTSVVAQEAAPDEEAATDAVEETEELTEAEKAARERELVESILEDESTDYSGEDEEEFNPTDDVLFEQSLAFPPDI